LKRNPTLSLAHLSQYKCRHVEHFQAGGLKSPPISLLHLKQKPLVNPGASPLELALEI